MRQLQSTPPCISSPFCKLLFFAFLAASFSSSSQAQPSDPKKASRPTPQVTHTAPKAIRVGTVLTLRFQIPDNEELDEVFLRFRRQGEIRYRSLRMVLQGGDTYVGVLREFQVVQPAIEYYAVGLDVGKKYRDLFASEKQPQKVLVTTQVPQAEDPARPAEGQPRRPPESDTGQDSSETVFSAARREQGIQNAPGVITVITEREIREGGWRDVLEILRYTVGIDINHNGHSPDIGVRGLNPSQAFGDKMIILVDGHNMAWRQFNHNLLNSSWVSLDNIKRIEIIRGPGSALWGANALSGVINIITKTNTDLRGFSASTGFSPLSQGYFLRLQGGQELFGGLTFRAAFSLDQSADNALTLAPIYEFKQKGGLNYVPSGVQSFSQSFYSQLSWRGLNLRFYQGRYSPSAVVSGSNLIAGSGNVGADESLLSTDRYVVRLSWTTLLGSWGTFSVWSAYDHYKYNDQAQIEVNPLGQFGSSPRLRGASQSFAIYEKAQGSEDLTFQRYYPACSELEAGSATPCIKLTIGSRGEQVCSLVANPAQAASEGKQYPFSPFLQKECRRVYNNGRYTVKQSAQDHRLEAGLLLSAQILENFSLTAGVEFEYLSMVGYHLPEYEAYNKTPNFSNIHFSGYLQLQYNIANFVEFTLGGRFDYDTQYNFVATPRASVVLTPGLGFYIKALYGNAFKAPSIQDRFLFLDRNAVLFGNPDLRPESVHTVELQVGWYRRGLMAISLNGYLSFFNDLIAPVRRERFDVFFGENRWKEIFGGENQLPSRLEDFVQKNNVSQVTTYGGEFEFRLFPVRGLNILASFGLFLGQDNNGQSLLYSSFYKGSLIASYAFQAGPVGLSISAGAVLSSGKKVPARGFLVSDASLPAKDIGQAQNAPIPTWDERGDPSLETPLYLNTYVAIQVLRILQSIDIGVRLSNFLNREQYDANDILFYPQQKLELSMWLRVRI